MYLREKYRRPGNAYPRPAKATSGYRFLNSELGRWTSRDPIGKWGGVSLYRFVRNDPNDWHDALGTRALPGHGEPPESVDPWPAPAPRPPSKVEPPDAPDVPDRAWDDPPALPPKELGPGCCICVVEPRKCYISIRWTGKLNRARRYTRNGRTVDEAAFGTAALVVLKHIAGRPVKGCHLHQAAWFYWTIRDQVIRRYVPDDYGSGVRPPSYPSYGGTWLFDNPMRIAWDDPGRMAEPYIDRFEAQVYVEEATTVRASYGYEGRVTSWGPPPSRVYSRWKTTTGP